MLFWFLVSGIIDVKSTTIISQDMYTYMATMKVVDVSKRIPGTEPVLDKNSPANQVLSQVETVKSFEKRLTNLQVSHKSLFL